MKKILLLCSMIVYGTIDLSAQTVYFSQDFNASNNKADYIGAGQNQFTGMEAVGTATVNVVNNKVQVVKKAGSGNNRAGFTKSTANAFGPAQFLKFSMEVKLSGNNTAVSNGFQFSVGAISGTAPALPGNAQMHSLMVVAPTKDDGKFTINLDNQSSGEFTGTATIIWYVNNSGKPVGYTAPDGSIASIPNDANSVWVVQGSTATLAIDRAAALTPATELRSFKLANNPSFDAIFEIDNIVLSEEPVVIIPEIVSVKQITNVTVPMRTSLTNALPKEVEVTYDNGQKGIATVNWVQDATVKYNGYRSGKYPVVGNLIPAKGTINPLGLKLNTVVTVKSDVRIVNAFTPNGDGRNDTWIIPDLQYYPEVMVEVYDKNGVRVFQSSDPKVGWDGKNLKGEIVGGSYLYVVNVITNGNVFKGVLTVIKE
ncbi:MAG: gliding motility-associated C-terminal domain-containing protein [Rufibacter sp.]